MTKKFVTPCKLPTPHEREILIIMIEECAEVQQRATKLLRFGRDEIQPGHKFNNVERLSAEIGDLYFIIGWARKLGLVDSSQFSEAITRKRKKLEKYMQTQPDKSN